MRLLLDENFPLALELESGAVRRVEVHWYEAHGVERVELKIKRYLE